MNFKKQILSITTLILSTLLLFNACSSSEEEIVNQPAGFDRSEMLQSIADNLIIPNFEAVQTSVNALHTSVQNFVINTTEQNLQTMRNNWVQVVKDHQHTNAFGFGPANLLLGSYANVLGAFPVNTANIEQNIQNSNFDLANSFATDIRGFYTVEYLIYGSGQSDAQLLSGFTQERRDYLVLIVNELKSTFDTIVSEWRGTYRNEFISNDGTSAGSSVSLLYNEFVKYYEVLKNFKVELPAGLTAGQAGPDGTLVEAYYSGFSRDLIIEHFESSKNIYFGRTRSGQSIIGFEEYLKSVVGGEDLVNATLSAITRIDNAIAALPTGELSANVGDQSLVTLRDELQANTANFKSSMSSLLGISITFNSGDGD